MKLLRPIREFHPTITGILFMMPIALGVLIYLTFNNQFSGFPKNLKSAYQLYDLNTVKGIFELVIYDLVHEEVNYRGLVLLIILATNWLRKQDWLVKREKVIKYAGYSLAIAAMIALNFFYVAGHKYYPVAVLGFGFVWGYLTIRTGSLLYPIAFHCASNAIAALAIIASYHLLY